MYINLGYLNNLRLPFKDKSKPLIVGSCGTYRLRTWDTLPTWRPKGRLDYQLLYEKLFKMEKRKLDQTKRQTWGELNPVTRKPENSRAYNRKKAQNWKKDITSSAHCV